MKKSLKAAIGTLAGIAALAALVPYARKKSEDELELKALLWQYRSQPDPENPGDRLISLNIGPEVAVEDMVPEEEGPILVDVPVEAAQPTEEPEPTLVEENTPCE